MPPEQRERFEAHLRECFECRQQLKDLQRLVATLRRVLAPPVPKGFVEGAWPGPGWRRRNAALKRPRASLAARSRANAPLGQRGRRRRRGCGTGAAVGSENLATSCQ
ncbi:MAG: anti-sigma factor family protein [Planctomycetota bacterium]